MANVPNMSGRVLDVGAGAGEFARRLRDRGASVSCIEPDGALSDRLRSDGFEVWPSVEMATGAFDGIAMVNVLEHIEHDRMVLTQLLNLLRPGGSLFVFVPAMQMLYSRFDRLIGHHRRYSKPQLQEVLNSSGFEVGDIRWFDSLGVLPAIVFKLLRQTAPSVSAVRAYDRLLFPVSRLADGLLGGLIGKNLYCTSTRPPVSAVGSAAAVQ